MFKRYICQKCLTLFSEGVIIDNEPYCNKCEIILRGGKLNGKRRRNLHRGFR